MNSLFGSEFEEKYRDWKAKQNANGAIYYINNELQVTSWNHPYIDQIIVKLDESFSPFKYAAYRTSLKLRALQVKTGMAWMNTKVVYHILLSAVPETHEGCISHCHALSVILKILHLSDTSHQHEEEIPKASEIILNLIINIYDLDHSGKLSYRSLGIALSALSSGKLKQKYKNFFAFIKDEENHIKKEELKNCILDLIQITDIIKESQAFGSNVKAAVSSCFRFADTSNNDCVNEEIFYKWLLQEPQTFIWLPTLHRIQATENIVHDIRCCVCLAMPIKGFRYRCLYCFKYDQCQHCFLQGLISHNHKQRHPMTEYCFPTSAKDNTKALLNILKNKIIGNQNQSKSNYLPVDDTANSFEGFNRSVGDVEDCQHSCNSESSDSGLANSSDNSPSGGDCGCYNQGFEDIKVEDNAGSNKSSSKMFKNSFPKEGPETLLNKMAERIQLLEQENRQLQRKLKFLQTKFELDSAFLEDNSFKPEISQEDCSTTKSMSSKLANLSLVSALENVEMIDSKETSLLLIAEDQEDIKKEPTAQKFTVESPQSSDIPQLIQSQSESSIGLMYQTCDMSLEIDGAKNKSKISEDHCDLDQILFISENTPVHLDRSAILGNKRSSSCKLHLVSETNPHTYFSRLAKSHKREGKARNAIDGRCKDYLMEKTVSPEITSIELSNIISSSFRSTPSFSHHHNLNSFQATPGLELRAGNAAVEPVYMSTPIVPSHLMHPPATNSEDKENHSKPIPKHLYSTASPLSAIPQWHRKKILLSCNSIQSCNASPTCDSTGQLTKLMAKADKIGDMINQGQSYLTTEDQECYEKMLQEFKKECMSDLTSNKFQMDPDDAEMLQAVFTIEEAMKDFVQATAQNQH
ncbi:dystrophin [Biomphalaria pfeifferi]|uniref:Dystrophin n=1 Tax=Biomphalaria pfeifferi TaxID=112525 RepID=A0AAD8EYD7_BIOPF|nr:dystrophin [Biomphalaria pfeifferi]